MQPIPSPPPLTAPNVPPYLAPKPFKYNLASPGTFTGTAPTAPNVAGFTGTAPSATPTAAFVAPTPGTMSAAGQFRLNQGLKGIERGAAARGTLLTGGLQSRLMEFGQDVASQEYDNDYRRALSTYDTNRDTEAQNFNQSRATYQDMLAGYDANRDTAAQNFSQGRAAFDDALTGFKTNADLTLASNAQGLSAATAGYDRDAAAGRTVYEDAAADAMRRTGVSNINSSADYRTQMLEYERQADEARRAQEVFLQQEAESHRRRSGDPNEARIAQQLQRQQQQEAERQRIEMERRAREQEELNRAAASRQNAATLAGPMAQPMPGTLADRQRRRAG